MIVVQCFFGFKTRVECSKLTATRASRCPSARGGGGFDTEASRRGRLRSTRRDRGPHRRTEGAGVSRHDGRRGCRRPDRPETHASFHFEYRRSLILLARFPFPVTARRRRRHGGARRCGASGIAAAREPARGVRRERVDSSHAAQQHTEPHRAEGKGARTRRLGVSIFCVRLPRDTTSLHDCFPPSLAGDVGAGSAPVSACLDASCSLGGLIGKSQGILRGLT